MPALQPVRGTQDLLPDEMRRHRRVTETAREQAALYGFHEIATPIFEFTEVFARPIGAHTDIVAKEMYSLKDRGGEDLSLRPEFTAGVVRALLSNGLTQSTPVKFYATGPVFRYERPQKGRLRQFHQINMELLGVAQPQADIEVIALADRILTALGIRDRVTLELNTLGDPESRGDYRKALVDYFSARRGDLSKESLRRLEVNPLRILDSKDPGDIAINADAPRFEDYLNEPSGLFFADVRAGLDRIGISYRLNQRLVRGLDYYTHTVFEFVTTDLGAQGTVLAGGRYDGLIEIMGGPAMPGVGWAGGVERLAMMIAEPPAPTRPIAIVPVALADEMLPVLVAQQLRDAGLVVELTYSGNLGRRMHRANRLGARAVVLLGQDEAARGAATVRDLDSGEQREVPLAELAARLTEICG